jgi:hypothetical protein
MWGPMPTFAPSDPAGTAFKNSAERFAFLKSEFDRGARTSAWSIYMGTKAEYESQMNDYAAGRRANRPIEPMPPNILRP